MKKTCLFCICCMMCLISFTGCRNDNENISSLDIESVNCEIIEDIDVFCEKPVKAGIYTDYSMWQDALNNTDVEMFSDVQSKYDEAFFEDKALIYIVDCSSGNSQCKYEGYEIKEVSGKQVLTINASYSTELLLNKLHAYHFFFTMDKDIAKNIDDVELDMVERK